MRALEINAEYFGISLLQLMENAGRNIAAEIGVRFEKNNRIIIFCGLGGNGGDGFVAARHLLSMGFKQVKVFLVGKGNSITHEATLANWIALQSLRESLSIEEISNLSELSDAKADIVVDAMLGTGTKGKLRPPIAQLVEHINSMAAFKISVDVPTGIDADTGEILSNAIKADVTVTFHKPKRGLIEAKNYVGKTVVGDIGLPSELELVAGPGDVLLVSKARATGAHKGDFGKALFIGGSEVFSGAPALMSMAALRTGLDLAYTAAPEKTAHDISSMSPNLITIKLSGTHLKTDDMKTLTDYLPFVDAVVVGPGAGLHPETKEFVEFCVKAVEEAGKPLLLDADGLKAFAEFKRPIKVPLILTPHAGEYAILTGNKLPGDLRERAKEVQRGAKELEAVILLKGKVDVIADKDRFKLNFTGNPGMTVGGTGDVLSGIIGALLAQKVDPFEAAVAGAFVNGATGDFAANKVGYHMVATDLLDFLPQVLNDPLSHLKVRKSRGKFS